VNKAGSFSTVDDKQANAVVSSDGFGGILIAWDDNRANPNQDVYATHRSSTLAVSTPTLTLTSPNGGEALHGLEPFIITWTSTMSPSANVKLEYKFGNARTLIISSTPNDGSFSWNVPNSNSTALHGRRVRSGPTGCRATAATRRSRSARRNDIPGSYGPVTGPNDAVLADLNRDGMLDLVGTGHFGRWVVPARHRHSRRRRRRVRPARGRRPYPAPRAGSPVADFNADGFLDVAATVGSGVTLLTGNGTGRARGGFVVHDRRHGARRRRGGLQRRRHSRSSRCERQQQLSRHSDRSRHEPGSATACSRRSWCTRPGTSPTVSRWVDLDNDGIFDLVVTNTTSNTIVVLKGQRGGRSRQRHVHGRQSDRGAHGTFGHLHRRFR
jgi:hypothetical protein